jgi:glycerol kinase
VSVLVIDVGTSGVRAAVVRPDGTVGHERHRALLPRTPAPGLVELDAVELADTAVELAREVLAEVGAVDALGICDQRATTVVWDRATGEPVGPAIGWQDLRTLGRCLELQGDGLRLGPNESATKLAHLLDEHDPDRRRDLCFGTVDTWLAWRLSEGAAHVTDLSNAAVSGLIATDGSEWDPRTLDLLAIPSSVLPALVDSSGIVAEATALPGAPPLAGILGDQQASLLGQGCVTPGQAKATFGSGAMLDVVAGPTRPSFEHRGTAGTFPTVAWRLDGEITWAIEAIMLSAGTNVAWLRDDLGLIDTVEASHEVAASCEHADGVAYVPAQLGLGTPHWDYGARGTLLGLTAGVGRPQVVRAVLEGVAQRGADLVEAAEADGGRAIEVLRVDGGMTRNPTFVQALADATGRPIEVSPVVDATTLGAGFAAGVAVGTWSGLGDAAATWDPSLRVEPVRQLDRARWREAVDRSRRWEADLSALEL